MNIKQTKKHQKLKKRKHGARAWYRFIRRIINAYRVSTLYIIKVRYRFARRIRFRIIRLTTFLFFKLWIKEIVGFNNIPLQGPAILVSNHLSYYDFLVLGSLFREQIVFLAVKKIRQTFFIRWFTKLHIVVYVDRDYPGITFFREIMRCFDSKKMAVIYPEGSRSRTGKMGKPKPGFVKLAIKTNVPIIPVAMRGTYQILPPYKHIPRLRKCSISIGEKFYISPETPYFKDIFFEQRGSRKFGRLTKEQMQKIAMRIMEKVRILADEQWDESVIADVRQAIPRKLRIDFALQHGGSVHLYNR